MVWSKEDISNQSLMYAKKKKSKNFLWTDQLIRYFIFRTTK